MDLPTTHYDNPSVAASRSTGTSEKGLLERISLYVFYIGVFLTPLIFIPSVYAPLDVVKSIFLASFILISSALYAINAIKKRSIVFPNYPVAYIAMAIIASVLISTFLSPNISKSFIGQGFETGTASFILLMFLASFFTSRIVIKDKEIIFNIYVAIFVSFIVLALFHIVRIIGGADFMTLGILGSITSTVVGKWYDFAILTAVAGLLSFLGIKFLSLGKGLKWLLSVSLVICGALLFVINLYFIWSVVALVVLGVMAYEYSTRTSKGNGIQKVFSRISLLSFLVLIIAITCAWKGNIIAAPLTRSLNVVQGEAVLPWQLTLDVATDTLKETPLFGAGPNRFVYQFLRFKPLEINPTQFWNSEFSSGFGTLPTFLITLGFVGAILWCVFFIFFFRDGTRALKRASDPTKKFFASSSFFIASFLWAMNLVYIPSHVIIFLTFLFTGLFIASLAEEGFAKEKEYSTSSSSKIGKYAPIIMALISILLIVWIGLYAKKAIAISFFQKGIKELNTNKSVDAAHNFFLKALSWDRSDIYYQALSEVNILKINALTQELQNQSAKNPSQSPDPKVLEQITTLIGDALKYTNSAIEVDPANYYNHISQARISELASSFRIPDAYEGAKNSYANALALNPYNPGIYLNLARLEASQKKTDEAQQYIGRALQLKQNYIEAIFLLSQIQVSNGQIKDAITSVQVASQINPNDPTIFFQLGILHYNDKNYTEATTALAKAVSLNSQYANAKYFLGLSLARLGKNADAIIQFEDLAKSNPDNKEVELILANLKEGKSPFTDAKPPIDSAPEKRKTLPVNEKPPATPAVEKEKAD